MLVTHPLEELERFLRPADVAHPRDPDTVDATVLNALSEKTQRGALYAECVGRTVIRQNQRAWILLAQAMT